MLQSIQAAANNANEVLVGGSMDQQLDSNPDKTAKRNLESDADVEKSLKKKARELRLRLGNGFVVKQKLMEITTTDLHLME